MRFDLVFVTVFKLQIITSVSSLDFTLPLSDHSLAWPLDQTDPTASRFNSDIHSSDAFEFSQFPVNSPEILFNGPESSSSNLFAFDSDIYSTAASEFGLLPLLDSPEILDLPASSLGQFALLYDQVDFA
jgi:hypothetical protein